ncbi:MAG: hypothetical protein Q9200_005900 [Gallowayella weberi]
MRAVRPSALLNAYFLSSLVFDIARIRTLLVIPDNRVIAIVFTMTVALKFLILLLEAKEKRGLLQPMYAHYPPEATSGIFGQNFFWWLNPLLRKGFCKVLSVDDLFPVDEDINSEALRRRLQSIWDKLANKQKPHALLRVTLIHYKWSLLSAIIPRLFLTGFTFAQPFLVNRVLKFITESDDRNTNNIGSGLIGAYALVYLGIGISNANYQHKTFRVITMIRGSLVSLIYRKTLDLNTTAILESASVTLMSADVERVGSGMQYMHEGWASIIEIGVALWLLQMQLGLAVVAPIVLSLGTY